MIRIFSSTCSRPDMIELQLRSFRRYLWDDFELTVFNNALLDRRRDAEYQSISDECRRLGVKHVSVERDLELAAYCQRLENYPIFTGINAVSGVYWGPNSAAQYADNWIWKHFISKEPGAIMLIHPDVFLVRPILLEDMLEKHDLWYIPQTRPGAGEYMHDAVVVANMQRLPEPEKINWCAGKINGVAVDGGGQTHFYLKSHELDFGYINIDYPVLPGRDAFPPPDYEMFRFGAEPEFLHYRTASNWNHMSDSYHREKTAWLKGILENGI